MTEHSNNSARPSLARDGVTIVRPIRGNTEDGWLFDGYEEFRPGDPGYDELLPAARENPISDDEAENPVDPDTLAQLHRAAGWDAPDELSGNR